MGPQGRGCAQWGWLPPLVCSQCQIFLNILEKIIFQFQGIWRTFIFGVFFIARIIQKTDKKILILFYLISITEIKRRVQRVVLSNLIHLMFTKRNPLTRLIKSCYKLIPKHMKPDNFRIALGYLNGDMHIPNNKNIIFLLDSRKRKFKTSNSNC